MTKHTRKKGKKLNLSDSEKVQCGQRPAGEVEVRAEEDGLEETFHAEEEEVAG